MKSTFNVISDGSSLLDEHRNDAWLIDSESEWLKCKKGCFKIRPPNSSLEVQHTVSAAVILPVISECPHTVILQNWASWVSGGAYRVRTSPLSSLHFRARGGGLQLLAGLRVRLVTDATIALLTRRFRGETSAWTCLRTEGAAALAI